MQSSNRFLGDIARLASGAMTMAAGAKTELEQLIQQRVERFLNEKGWVAREEFDAVRSLLKERERIRKRYMSVLTILRRNSPQNLGAKLVLLSVKPKQRNHLHEVTRVSC